MQRTPIGWRTPAILAIGTVVLLDSGESCEVIEVGGGYSWCTPLP